MAHLRLFILLALAGFAAWATWAWCAAAGPLGAVLGVWLALNIGGLTALGVHVLWVAAAGKRRRSADAEPHPEERPALYPVYLSNVIRFVREAPAAEGADDDETDHSAPAQRRAEASADRERVD